jgi:hypothetical protein
LNGREKLAFAEIKNSQDGWPNIWIDRWNIKST